MHSLKNKLALITGGTSGIGAATALEFVNNGAEVIIIGRNEDKGNKLAKELNSISKTEFIKCDVSDKDQIITLNKYISEKYKKLDILFNNAGCFITKNLEELTDEDWHKSFITNVDSAMYMTKYFIELLKNNNGNIIYNASISGLESYTNGKRQYIYATTKAAIIKFSKLVAKNYAPNVRSNCICPGVINTDLFTNKDFSRFNDTIPMRRVGNPNEVAKLVRFLASEESSYITGAVIPVDGGASLT